MTFTGLDSPEVQLLRRSAPEFEQALAEDVRLEGPEIGSFQIVSLLAEWVCGRLDEDPNDGVSDSVLDAVESILTAKGFPLGGELGAEFIEVVRHHARARALMRPITLEIAQRGRETGGGA